MEDNVRSVRDAACRHPGHRQIRLDGRRAREAEGSVRHGNVGERQRRDLPPAQRSISAEPRQLICWSEIATMALVGVK